MSAPLLRPWTRDEFLDWVERQEERYEFDGVSPVRPVGMVGGTLTHNRITCNIHAALRARLRGTGCSYYGSDVGVGTIGDGVRFPDALVTCTQSRGTARLAEGVVAVFEVESPSSSRVDHIVKVHEYAAVPSIRCYVIVESTGIGLQVFHRGGPDDLWQVTTLAAAEDILRLPEVGIELPVGEIYEDVAFDDDVRPRSPP